MDAGVAHGDVLFIAVGTPHDEDGSADLTHVLAVARHRPADAGGKVIVNKSTVPVGTARRVTDVIAAALTDRNARHAFSVVSNPEFLKEGAAFEDFMLYTGSGHHCDCGLWCPVRHRGFCALRRFHAWGQCRTKS
ncbi:hypothetical protein WL42_14065 [Burkholderia ubonensis]|nr:hypothetical protein WL42_14065 [Burkholderia ubonensis]